MTTLRLALGSALILALAVITSTTLATHARASRPRRRPAHTAEVVNAPACAAPAPATAAAYQALWATLPAAQWAAADLSLSVPLADGRDVWLYGDTFTNSGDFHHSTAIVQTGGCLHVSGAGAQLLPNDPDGGIYWINSARSLASDRIEVNAQAIMISGTGILGFTDRGYARTANLTVTPSGDIAFDGWTGTIPGDSPVGTFEPIPGNTDPTHFGYARTNHPEAHLADGKTLQTICQGWTDTALHPFTSLAPIFEEAS